MIRAAVLGFPIAHSLSPFLHELAYKELAIAGEYSKIEVEAGQLSHFLDSLDDSWTGFSLTMPLKQEAVQIVDSVTDLSRKIRSANTLFRKDGDWHATTTDVAGFTHAFQAHAVDISSNVLIIGAGATARAAAAACDGLATRITVMARSTRGIDLISNCVETSEIGFALWADEAVIQEASVIISTTPEGATDSLVHLFPRNPESIFFDVLYKPWPTLALATWIDNGGHVIDGLDLLIHQAISQVEIFTGLNVERSSMAQRMREAAILTLTSST